MNKKLDEFRLWEKKFKKLDEIGKAIKTLEKKIDELEKISY